PDREIHALSAARQAEQLADPRRLSLRPHEHERGAPRDVARRRNGERPRGAAAESGFVGLAGRHARPRRLTAGAPQWETSTARRIARTRPRFDAPRIGRSRRYEAISGPSR